VGIVRRVGLTKAYEDAYLITKLVELASQLGRTPSSQEMTDRKGFPSARAYQTHFGNWREAIRRAGLSENRIDRRRCKKYQDEYLISVLTNLKEAIGRTPSERDMDSLTKGYPSSRTVSKRFGIWCSALEKAGLTPLRKPRQTRLTKTSLLKTLNDLRKELGRMPTARDLAVRQGLPPLDVYETEFGTLDNALRAATERRTEVARAVKAFIEGHYNESGMVPSSTLFQRTRKGLPCLSTIRRYFGSWNQLLREIGYHEVAEKQVRYRYSDEELLEYLHKASVVLGRTPRTVDMDSLQGFPRFSVYCRRFGSWNRALKRLNIEVNRYDGATREEMLLHLRTVAKELKRTPTQWDMTHEKGGPSAGTYVKRFGSWLRAIDEAGLDRSDQELWAKWEYVCFQMAKALYGSRNVRRGKVKKIIGTPDIYVESEKLIIDAMVTSYFSDRKESEIERYMIPGHRLEFWCIHKALEYEVDGLRYVYLNELKDKMMRLGRHDLVTMLDSGLEGVRGFYTREELTGYMKRLAVRLGRTPRETDMQNARGFPSSALYVQRFGSWTNALKEAGIRPTREYLSEDELVEKLKQLSTILGRPPTQDDMNRTAGFPSSRPYFNKFGTWSKALARAGLGVRRRDYTEDELVALLKEAGAKLNRVPMQRDLDNFDDYPRYGVFKRRFGSWNNALRTAGFTLNRYRGWDKTKLITVLREYVAEKGRVPSQREINEAQGYPSSNTFAVYFGTWSNALREAKLM